jgi:hypothetical protein
MTDTNENIAFNLKGLREKCLLRDIKSGLLPSDKPTIFGAATRMIMQTFGKQDLLR